MSTTMNLYSWALRHGIPAEAIDDLRQQFGLDQPTAPPVAGNPTTEEGVSAHVRLAYARAGCMLWRNNLGAMQDDNGRVVRYGLCNDSKAINTKIKSSDLIGITPVVVTQAMVGSTVGVFISIECKKPGWKYTGTDHEQAQLKWIEIVVGAGGYGHFTNGVDGSVSGSVR